MYILYVQIYIYIHMCIYIYIRTDVCVHIYIYMYMQYMHVNLQKHHTYISHAQNSFCGGGGGYRGILWSPYQRGCGLYTSFDHGSHVYIYTYIHDISMYICNVYTCIYTHVCINVRMYIYIYTYIYICTHMYVSLSFFLTSTAGAPKFQTMVPCSYLLSCHIPQVYINIVFARI